MHMLQELLLETDRNRSAKERTEQAAKAAREAAEATQRHEKELQVRLKKNYKKKCLIRLLLYLQRRLSATRRSCRCN